MRLTFYTDLQAAIKMMHYAYGAGTIHDIRQTPDGRIEVDAQRTSCGTETIRGRLHWRDEYRPFGKVTIYLHKRQRTVCIIGPVDH